MLSGPGDLLVFSELTLSLTDCDEIAKANERLRNFK